MYTSDNFTDTLMFSNMLSSFFMLPETQLLAKNKPENTTAELRAPRWHLHLHVFENYFLTD